VLLAGTPELEPDDDIQRFHPGFRKGREGETMAMPAFPTGPIPWIGVVKRSIVAVCYPSRLAAGLPKAPRVK
jgi:hypothetical protein